MGLFVLMAKAWPSNVHALVRLAWMLAFSLGSAHHLESRVRLNELVTDIIREARERVDAYPKE